MSEVSGNDVCVLTILCNYRDDITPPEFDEETSSLRKLQKQIREERQKLTEAAIKLGEERTQLMVSLGSRRSQAARDA